MNYYYYYDVVNAFRVFHIVKDKSAVCQIKY